MKSKIEDEERLRKIAMRQVRARLLKFNLKDEDSEESEEVVKPPPPPPVQNAPASQQPIVKKKESKWGKVSSN